MQKLFIVLLFAVSACASKTEMEVPPVGSQDLPAMAGTTYEPAIKPVPKPRPDIHSKEYTAPYPTLTKPTRVAASVPVKTVVTKERSRGTSTASFLGKSPKFQEKEVVELKAVAPAEEKSKLGPNVQKAVDLPPKQIEEGRYRTFRHIENDMQYDSRKMRGTIAEFIFPEINDIEEKPQPKPNKPVYCYKSFADSTCYSEPIPGQEFRRVGKVIE